VITREKGQDAIVASVGKSSVAVAVWPAFSGKYCVIRRRTWGKMNGDGPGFIRIKECHDCDRRTVPVYLKFTLPCIWPPRSRNHVLKVENAGGSIRENVFDAKIEMQ
jgi:hypothetical protein